MKTYIVTYNKPNTKDIAMDFLSLADKVCRSSLMKLMFKGYPREVEP